MYRLLDLKIHRHIHDLHTGTHLYMKKVNINKPLQNTFRWTLIRTHPFWKQQLYMYKINNNRQTQRHMSMCILLRTYDFVYAKIA